MDYSAKIQWLDNGKIEDVVITTDEQHKDYDNIFFYFHSVHEIREYMVSDKNEFKILQYSVIFEPVKVNISTQVTNLEQWTLSLNETKSFCDYLRGAEPSLGDKSDLEILRIIEANTYKYNDLMRSWLYDNLEEPLEQLVGEEGACVSFKDRDFQKSLYVDEGHVHGIKYYTESEAIRVIRDIIKEDKDIRVGAEDKLSDDQILDLGAKWYSIHKE